MSRNFVIIHIGMHKTGTTYLQYNFFPKLENVIYAHGNHFFRPWRDQVSENKNHLLLSYEGFSGIAWNECWKLGKRNGHNWSKSFEENVTSLKKFFPDAIIIIVMRRHGDLLVSLYKQYIQEGGFLSLKGFYGDNGVISPSDLNLKFRIDIIKKNFSNCYFLNFERFKKYGDKYIETFFKREFEGIEINDRLVNSLRNKNRSISGKKIVLLRMINPYYYRLPKKAKGIIRYLRLSPRDIFQTKLSFWSSPDNDELENLRINTNKSFQEDWEFFKLNEWQFRELLE